MSSNRDDGITGSDGITGDEDIESLVRELTRDFKGVDMVLAFCYNDGESRQKARIVRTAGSPGECRKLVQLVWQALQPATEYEGEGEPSEDTSEDPAVAEDEGEE